MRRGLVSLLLTALFVAVGLVVASPAQACSCAGDATTAQNFTDADAVFSGTLVSRSVEHPDWPVFSSADPALLVFETDVVYKGQVHEQQGVVTAADGASCGLELTGSGPFVIFADRSPDLADGRLRAGLCGGTRTADPALLAELVDLAGPESGPVLEGAAGTDPQGLGRVPTFLLGAGLLGGLVAGVVLVRRRRRAAR